MRRLAVFFAACACLLTGCESPKILGPGEPIALASQYFEAECALGTQASDVQQFHALLYYPYEHALRFPGMVIGIEKSADNLVKRGAASAAARQPQRHTAEERFVHKRVFEDSKSMFISHVVSTGAGGAVADTPLYNAYDNAKRIDPTAAQPGQPVDCKGQPVAAFDAFGDSWKAVQAVKTQLAKALATGAYTDVVVLSMGWNTNQIEAVQNYNSLIHNLSKAAESRGDRFVPYVIGITWPSEWVNPWLEPAVRAVSVFNKADDADEVGAGWMGAIIRHGVLPVTQQAAYNQHDKLRVTVLGHSFGARATSMAVCNGSILTPPAGTEWNTTPPAAGAVRWLVGLQGAYSLNRDLPDGAGLFKLRYDGCKLAGRQLLTASAHDNAAGVAAKVIRGAPFAGQKAAWDALKAGPHHSAFNFHTATATGGLDATGESLSASAWDYVDASALVFYNAYGTGGGAHSDIYRPQMGQLLWEFLRRE